jgi:hypothetical protein
MLLLCPLPAPSQRSSTSPDPDRQPNADRTSKRLYLHAADMVHEMPFEDPSSGLSENVGLGRQAGCGRSTPGWLREVDARLFAGGHGVGVAVVSHGVAQRWVSHNHEFQSSG